MKLKPIPLKLLPHTVTYEQFVKGDGIETSDGYLPPVTLSRVLIQDSEGGASLVMDGSVADVQYYRCKLFYDAVQSRASGPFEFVNDSIVTYKGKRMKVRNVSEYGLDKLHHYEVILV